MRKSVESLDMIVDATQEALRQAGLNEESLCLLLTRREEFRRMLIQDIRSSIEAVTNERLRDIFERSRKLEESNRKNPLENPEAVIEDIRRLMQDATSVGSSVRERQQRMGLEGLISYWASILRIRTGELVLGPDLDPFLPRK